ncbi:asparaginase [Hoyosella sp. G463]|uniref:Asparaginase n=1 Tax=Lolliginicoccus lacisalsi TaxID=2742202 RepID=A0A927PLJ0_9ACTN|nr:asparaginase [Lolliginicoccus lacisalsi]MBD8505879.1 asparaginase [Lolliginicoccus lacisalsi]
MTSTARFVPLVDVVRSGFTECTHYGSLIVLDKDGESLLELGDARSPLFPRSTNKPLQSVGLLRAGYQPASRDELALATSSHCAEPQHLAIIERMLGSAGLREEHLLCPPDMPWCEQSRARMLASGHGPRRIFMNCSGKHAAMLATCQRNGWPLDTYLQPDHPLQEVITSTVRDLSDADEAPLGIDGCGLPIIPVPLAGLARAFARLVSAPSGSHEHAVAAAARAHPLLLSGTGAPDAVTMAAIPGMLCKSGADGVFAGALADGRSFAFKISDGHDRARLPLVRAVLEHLDVAEAGELPASPVLGGGHTVGEIRARVSPVAR